jgi:hypothetical protein
MFTGMTVYHLPAGRTAYNVRRLKDTIPNPQRTAIIINSWEMASSNYRYREELIFALHELQMTLGITVFVFAMANASRVKSRQLNRAGLGKLSIAADQDARLWQSCLRSKKRQNVRASFV